MYTRVYAGIYTTLVYTTPYHPGYTPPTYRQCTDVRSAVQCGEAVPWALIRD